MDDDFVKELVWSLKPEFQEKKFSEVEKVLKDKFTREIESLKAKWQVEKLDKLEAEREIKKLKELNSRLMKEWNDDKNLIVKLQKKIGDLGCEKLRAESDLEVLKKRFEELETRCERAQNELEHLAGLMNARVTEETNHVQEKERVFSEVKTEVDANGDEHFESLERGDNAGKKKTSGSEGVESVPNCGENNEIPTEKVMTEKKKTRGNDKVDSLPNRGKNNEIPLKKVDQSGSSKIKSMNNAGTQEKKVIEVDVGGRNDGIFRNGSEPSEGTAGCRTADKKGGKKMSSGSEEVDGGANRRKNNEISAEKVYEIGSLNLDTSMDDAVTQEKKVIEVDVGGRKKRLVTNDSEPNQVTASCRTVDKKAGIGRPSEIINLDSDDDSSSPKSTNLQGTSEMIGHVVKNSLMNRAWVQGLESRIRGLESEKGKWAEEKKALVELSSKNRDMAILAESNLQDCKRELHSVQEEMKMMEQKSEVQEETIRGLERELEVAQKEREGEKARADGLSRAQAGHIRLMRKRFENTCNAKVAELKEAHKVEVMELKEEIKKAKMAAGEYLGDVIAELRCQIYERTKEFLEKDELHDLSFILDMVPASVNKEWGEVEERRNGENTENNPIEEARDSAKARDIDHPATNVEGAERQVSDGAGTSGGNERPNRAEKLLKRKRSPAGPALSDTDNSSSSSESEDEPDLSFDFPSTIKFFKK